MRKKEYTKLKIRVIDVGARDVITASLWTDEDYFNPSWVATNFGGDSDD